MNTLLVVMPLKATLSILLHGLPYNKLTYLYYYQSDSAICMLIYTLINYNRILTI